MDNFYKNIRSKGDVMNKKELLETLQTIAELQETKKTLENEIKSLKQNLFTYWEENSISDNSLVCGNYKATYRNGGFGNRCDYDLLKEYLSKARYDEVVSQYPKADSIVITVIKK